MTQQEAPFAHPSTTPATGAGARRKGRPAFGLLVVVTGVLRFGREILERVAFSRFGFVGVVAVVAAVILLMLLWRAGVRRRVRARGGVELTPELAAKQIADSGMGPPAFAEDGTLLGASVLVVNQRSKILEVNTEYEVFGSSGRPLGAIRQIGQSRRKSLARIVTPFASSARSGSRTSSGRSASSSSTTAAASSATCAPRTCGRGTSTSTTVTSGWWRPWSSRGKAGAAPRSRGPIATRCGSTSPCTTPCDS